LTSVARGQLSDEPEDADPLLDELDEASRAAKQVLGDVAPKEEAETPSDTGASDEKGENQPDTAPVLDRNGEAPPSPGEPETGKEWESS